MLNASTKTPFEIQKVNKYGDGKKVNTTVKQFKIYTIYHRYVNKHLYDDQTDTLSHIMIDILLANVCRRPPVCLSVVCNVRAPYSGDWNFWQCFYAIWYLGHLWTFGKNITEIVPGEPLRRTFPRLCLGNGEKIGGKLLLITKESRIWTFDWYQNRWPWMTLNGVIALTAA